MTDGEAAGALAALAALGAFHGVNPAMGWLFAVALGMQERRSSAMWRAIAAIAAGHALAIAAAIAFGAVALTLLPGGALRAGVAVLLVALGVLRLFRARHPRTRASMRVGFAGLTAWSFLVASAHGAGLMVLPVVLGSPGGISAHAAHAPSALPAASLPGGAAVAVHTAAYLLVTAAIAWVVYAKVGVGLLRRAWINLDAIWAVALIVSGVAALFLI
jgi:hypothetical protein